MAGGYWRKRAEYEGGLLSPTRGEDALKAIRSTVATSRRMRDVAEANMDAVQDAASKRIDRIGDAYHRAARDLTNEVEKIIGRYADRFKLTREEALAALKQPFDRDSRAYGYRMSRAEALRETARLKAQELGAITEKQTAAQIAYTTDAGYRLARKTLTEMGATASFAKPDMAGLRRSLETSWKGASYSTRVWNNVERLAKTLDEEVTAAFLSGKSNARIAEIITERFGSSFREAERLVRTETSYVHNQAALYSYGDAGLEEYEYLTAHDSRTCKLCGTMDRKRFALSEAEVGVNMPPMHPFCRCTILPVVAGMDDSSPLHGRGEYGEDVQLPGDMRYEEYEAWAKAGYPEDVAGWLQKRRDSINTGGYSGAKKTDDWEERHAKRYYEEIRKRSAGVDAKRIAACTPFSEEAAEEIRQHMFFRLQPLENGTKMARFDPDYYQSVAWQRLTEGKPKDSDLTMLKHEYVELTQMRLHGYNYDEAHRIANARHNWWSEILEAGAKEG